MARSLAILVVDDDPDFAESLADLLELRGHQAVVAPSAEDALELFREGRFDLVFLDLMLPGIGGMSGLRAMRALNPNAHVVVMTGANAKKFSTEAATFGALKLLQKPFDPVSTMRKIENLIGGGQ